MSATVYGADAPCPAPPAWPLELRDNRAYWRGEQVDLTFGDLAVVSRLVSVPGVDVAYRHLYDAAVGLENFLAGYGDGPEAGYRANTRSFIKRIRRKFLDLDSEFQAIENYPGFGYRWKAE